jgi:hypothetical protein
MSVSEWSKKIDMLVSNIRMCGDPEKIRTPGQSSFENFKRNKENIFLSSKNILDITERLGYFGINLTL